MAGIPQVITEDRASGAQFIDGSLKFDSSKLQYLTRTPTTAGNRGKWTWSCWCKRGKGGVALFAAYSSDADRDVIRYGGTAVDSLDAQLRDGTNRGIYTTSKFRDTGWYHNVVTYDSTVGVKIYVNGVEQPKSNASGGNASLRSQINNTVEQYIGARKSGGNIEAGWDGYMGQVYFLDGIVAGPEEFAYTDPLTNTWRPKKYDQSGPNNGTTWSLGTTAGTIEAARPWALGFDGNENTFTRPDSNQMASIMFDTPINFSSKFEIRGALDSNNTGSIEVYDGTDAWINVSSSFGSYGQSYDYPRVDITSSITSPVKGIRFNGVSAVYQPRFTQIYVDDKILIDGDTSNIGLNGFHLPMDGNTPIGKDQSGNGNDWEAIGFGGSVDLPKATGAIPILNTNEAGTVAKPGVRTDKKTYTVTASGGKYYLDGVETPTLNFLRGGTYIFDYTGATSHPFKFSTTSDGTHNSGSEYTDGTNTATTNVMKITVPHNAPDTLYYYCSAHSGMGSSINVTTDIFKADPYAWKCMFAMASDTVDHSPEINVNSTASIFGDIHTTTLQGLRNFYGHSKKMESGGGFRIDMELTTAEANAKHKFDTNDFTLECWHYNDGSQSAWHSLFRSAAYNNPSGTGGTGIAHYGYSQSLYPYSVVSGTGQNWGQTGNVVPYKKWHHTAWTRQGSVNRIFANGILVKTFTNSNSWDNRGWEIGDVHTWTGGYQDARIYNGVAKYTENFVVPATEPDILPDTPSGITSKTNLAKITEGAVAFDGNGDYLSLASTSDFDFGTGDFTCELFFRCTNYSNTPYFFDFRTTGGVESGAFAIYVQSTGEAVFWYNGSNRVISNNKITLHSWVHLAVVRSSGTTKMYIDGVAQTSSYSDSNDYGNGGSPLLIGVRRDSGSVLANQSWNGQLSNVRVLKGTALYTSDFTPPTEPLTEVTNTKLLCCQSNTSASAAAVVPFKVNNNSGTAGAYAPTGLTGGIDFPSGQGTSNHSNGMYLSNPSTTFPGNYTIEFWFNVDSLPSDGSGGYGSVFWDGRPPGVSADNVFGSIYGYNTTGGSNDFTIRYHMSGDRISGTTNLSVGTWYHYALVRNNGTVTQYINGTADGSTYSHSTAMISNADRPYIGAWGYGETGSIPGHDKYAVDGKISNLRMTSTAVYTANFTPPTSNLTVIPGTTFLGLQSTSSATAYTSASRVLGVNGNAAATNFNPLTDDINTIRGQASGYCTYNPLNVTSSVDLKGGNLQIDHSGTPQMQCTVGNVFVSTGKYYAEITKLENGIEDAYGIVTDAYQQDNAFYSAEKICAYKSGQVSYSTMTPAGFSPFGTAGQVLGLYMDLDNQRFGMSLDGGPVVFVNIGDYDGHTAGERWTWMAQSGSTGGNGSFRHTANFGQKPFKFPPTDGFQPLNLSNVKPEKVIARPDQYVGTTLYTGSGETVSPRTIELPFAADLVWAKQRDRSSSHQIADTVRGNNLVLRSNSTATAQNPTTQFNGGGISIIDGKTISLVSGINNNENLNATGQKGVVWSWKAGGNKNTFNIDDVGYANASDVNMSVGALNSVVYNQSQVWSNSSSDPNSVKQSGAATELFNGNLSSGGIILSQRSTSNTAYYVALDGVSISCSNSVACWMANGASTATMRINGDDNLKVSATSTTLSWVTLNFTGTITKIELGYLDGSGSSNTYYGIQVDGKTLIDQGVAVTNVPSIAPIGCSVGTKQGFSIIQYQAPTEGDLVPHGLSQKPSFMIIKNMDASGDWFVYHHKANTGADMTSSQGLNLNNTGALFSSGSNTFITGKDSSTFTVGSSSIVRTGTNDFIAYIWHDVPGLQKFGTYINPSSTAGGFVELGFKPAVLIYKCAVNISSSSGLGDWIIIDTTRSPVNRDDDNNTLVVNVSNEEDNYYTASQASVDILSNGFKIRHPNSSPGGDPGRLYVYAAWAETPSINLYGGQANAR